jgi:hypothetical protein
VFALANGKPWVSAPSEYRSIKIPDLARTLGATRHLVDEQTSDEQFADLLGTPLQADVGERVERYRAQSDAYLDAALS